MPATMAALIVVSFALRAFKFEPLLLSAQAPDKIVMGRAAFYCDRTVLEYLDLQASNKTNVLLQQQQWDGMPVTTYRGIPFRCCDALLDTEARVL